ncbi:MAG: LuxR family transcriptional regulator [Alphaproteobacteria bacterium]|nr:LuxR family transcriptional regulator [Alphaproteobacteria bacterium]
MLSIKDYIYELHATNTVEDAFAVLQRYLAKMGLDRAIYSVLTDIPALGVEAGHAILGNYPEEWMAYYTEKNYMHIDPVRKAVKLTHDPFWWSDMHRIVEVGAHETQILEEAKDAKVADGLGFGMHGPNGQIAGVGVASSCGGVDRSPHTLAMVRLLVFEFNAIFMQRKADEQRKLPALLTRRETEVLCWLARGKTVPEARAIMSIDGCVSEATLRYHVKNIYTKLEVSTAPQAVAKALSRGILTYADLQGYI